MRSLRDEDHGVAREHKVVRRLHGGDPRLYAFAYEADVEEADDEVEDVRGGHVG